MCSYFFLSTFLATLNTSTSKTKTIGKQQQGRSKKDEEDPTKRKLSEKKEEGGAKTIKDDQKPAKPVSSQIPKKTSPKKPLVPVKEEPSSLKKDSKRGNCKYAC